MATLCRFKVGIEGFLQGKIRGGLLKKVMISPSIPRPLTMLIITSATQQWRKHDK